MGQLKQLSQWEEQSQNQRAGAGAQSELKKRQKNNKRFIRCLYLILFV